MTDSLSRLRAGLDRDEAIARAASEIHGEHWRPGAAFGNEWDRLEGSGISAIGYDMHESAPPHLARHDPSRVLRQSEVFRKLLAEYDSHLVYGPPFEDSELEGNGPDVWEGRDQVFKLVFEELASIYTEDTTETGEIR